MGATRGRPWIEDGAIRRTCYHEAAHAVVAWRLGVPFTTVEVRVVDTTDDTLPPGARRLTVSGIVRIPPLGGPVARDPIDRRLLVLLAGRQVHARLGLDEFEGDDDDERIDDDAQARHLARQLVAWELGLTQPEPSDGPIIDVGVRDYLIDVSERAGELVDRDWPLIDALARDLAKGPDAPHVSAQEFLDALAGGAG
jgi:hypothetical protein